MTTGPTSDAPRFDPKAVERPDPLLLKHYFIASLLSGPAFFIAFPIAYIKYRTLRYRFDDDGVWMGVGLLFKREVNLAYRRIQDINVTRGIIQRWLGLASVAVQTASGSATPEMTIEGVLDPDGLRDYLYAKMRGAKGQGAEPTSAVGGPEGGSSDDEALVLLKDIRVGVESLATRVRELETRLDGGGS